MLHVFQAESLILDLIEGVLIVVKLFAFINSLMWSGESYAAANKLTKPTWAIILAIGLAVQLILGGALGIFNIVFTIAAFVYLADVRPALASLTRR